LPIEEENVKNSISNLRRLAVYGIFSAVFIVVTDANAAAGSNRYVPLQEQAQGQSLTGANLLNDSLFSNPASSAFTNVYTVDATFTGPKNFSASILDTRTSPISGAMGYSRQPTLFENQLVQSAQGAMSTKVLPYLAFGLGGHILWAPDALGKPGRHTDLDFGALLNFDAIQIGMSVRSLMGGDTGLGDPRQTSIGARINYQQTMFFSATVQSEHNSMKPDQYGFGAEYISPYRFSLKGGYRIRPSENRSYWSAGFGILSPKVALNYAVVFPRINDEAVQHLVGATVMF